MDHPKEAKDTLTKILDEHAQKEAEITHNLLEARLSEATLALECAQASFADGDSTFGTIMAASGNRIRRADSRNVRMDWALIDVRSEITKRSLVRKFHKQASHE